MNDAVEYLNELCSFQGAAVAQCKDGTVFLIKRAVLQDLLSKQSDSDRVVIFVKTTPESDVVRN